MLVSSHLPHPNSSESQKDLDQTDSNEQETQLKQHRSIRPFGFRQPVLKYAYYYHQQTSQSHQASPLSQL
ncbi:hypothetical protein HanIR_Chr14g0706301 [Helianthus annuus]|nr:hypothetical protein HanIR_Chr14g0706301 [Helianthus annuus]